MTPVTPIRQPPVEDLRNALQILIGQSDRQVGLDAPSLYAALRQVLLDAESVERLIRHALAGLSEPNAAMLAATEQALEYHQSIIRHDSDDWAHYIRDTAQALLDAQVKGPL